MKITTTKRFLRKYHELDSKLREMIYSTIEVEPPTTYHNFNSEIAEQTFDKIKRMALEKRGYLTEINDNVIYLLGLAIVPDILTTKKRKIGIRNIEDFIEDNIISSFKERYKVRKNVETNMDRKIQA